MKNGVRILTQVLRGILIAVLIGMAAMLVPSLITPRHHDHRPVRTLNDLNGLANSIANYTGEYARLPTAPSLDFETEGTGAVDLITVLLGKEESGPNMENPHQILFLNVSINKNKKQGGLVHSADRRVVGIYDAWGNPLRVILRPPGQAMLTVPHAGKQVTTSKPAVVLSRGRDGTWGTKDDLISAT